MSRSNAPLGKYYTDRRGYIRFPNDHCAASAEVMTPDAALRRLSCGKRRKGHGRWHENLGVRWRGRHQRPIYRDEFIDNEVKKAFA